MKSPDTLPDTFTDGLGNDDWPPHARTHEADILRDVNGRPVRFDRRGPYGQQQPEQRWEQTQGNRPNLFRRWVDRALSMGTPGEWASDAAATVTLAAGISMFFLFVLMFAP